MFKFHKLDVGKLTIVNLAGLSNETIIAGTAAGSAIGSLGTTALTALVSADNAFRAKLITTKGSQLTKQLQEIDKQRDENVLEIWRTASTASKSSIATIAAAGQELVTFMKPYHNVQKEPMMSETSTLNYLQTQFTADTALQTAAATLQLTTVFTSLFKANEQVSTLWNERALEEAEKSGPSPSSLRPDLERCYNSFCTVIDQTINLTPSTALENLFSVMNEIRIKYAKSLPVKITDANTSVAPIPVQVYTGKAITPIPRVSFKMDDDKFIELLFTVDFYVTYRNNTDVGEAKIIIHGKGKYTGTYTSTFHIERNEDTDKVHV
jgi:hypothetical protein